MPNKQLLQFSTTCLYFQSNYYLINRRGNERKITKTTYSYSKKSHKVTVADPGISDSGRAVPVRWNFWDRLYASSHCPMFL